MVEGPTKPDAARGGLLARAWIPLLAATVLGPLTLTAVAVGLGAGASVADDISARSEQALTAAGIDGAAVDVNGRDVRVSGVDVDQHAAAGAAVAEIDGVRAVDVATTGGDSGEPTLSDAVDQASDGDQQEASPNDDAASSTQADDSGNDDAASATQDDIDAALQANPVVFEPDTAQLSHSASNAVQHVAAVLHRDRDVEVRVDGHTSPAPGSEDEAQRLSAQRAEAVMRSLTDAGIDADRIAAEGFGSTRPLTSNDTIDDQAANRRVEIIVQ